MSDSDNTQDGKAMSMTLGEYLEQNEHVVVFEAGVGCPTGRHWPAGCEGWEIPLLFLVMGGSVDEDNCWSWDGFGDLRDPRGNSVTKITASVAPRQWSELVEDYNAPWVDYLALQRRGR